MASFSVVLFTAAPGPLWRPRGPACSSKWTDANACSEASKCSATATISNRFMSSSPRNKWKKPSENMGHLGFSGVKLIAGGQQWMDQIAAAGEKISVECSHVILHDAARPAVAYSDLEALCNELKASGGRDDDAHPRRADRDRGNPAGRSPFGRLSGLRRL